MCSSAPDMTAANTAAAASAATGQQALDWYKQMYTDSAGDRKIAADDAHAVSAAQLESMKQQGALANEYADYNRTTFRPLETGLVADAANFDTEGKREELAGKALGDVNSNFASAIAQGERNLTRRGVNVNDGSFTGTMAQLGTAQALAGADAQNKARLSATTMAHAMKMDAASLGRNLPSSQATSAGLSINAGNASAVNAGLPLSQQQQQAAMMGAGYDAANRGYSTAGNIYGGVNQVTAGVNSSNSATMGSAGAAAGSIAAMVII